MKIDQHSNLVTIPAARQPSCALGFLLAAALLIPACKPEPGPAGGGDPAGVYALATVDGKAVPAAVTHDGVGLEVRSGSFTIKADGSCQTTTVFVPPSGKEVNREVTATYVQSGAKFTMKWQGAGTTTGVLSSNTFTMDNEGMVFVYRK
jgi:hypothetical protein